MSRLIDIFHLSSFGIESARIVFVLRYKPWHAAILLTRRDTDKVFTVATSGELKCGADAGAVDAPSPVYHLRTHEYGPEVSFVDTLLCKM